jgi:hypothetical protein
MRSLVEQDRQVDGHFTGYNAPLERTVLKKAKYMATPKPEGGQPAPAKAAGEPPVAADKPLPKEASHPLFAAPPAEEL